MSSDRLGTVVAVCFLDIVGVVLGQGVFDCVAVCLLDALDEVLYQSIVDCVKVHDGACDRLSLGVGDNERIWLTETEALSTEVRETVPLRAALSDKVEEAGAPNEEDALRGCERLCVDIKEKLFVTDSRVLVLHVNDCVSVGVNSTEGVDDRHGDDVAVYVIDLLDVVLCGSVGVVRHWCGPGRGSGSGVGGCGGDGVGAVWGGAGQCGVGVGVGVGVGTGRATRRWCGGVGRSLSR